MSLSLYLFSKLQLVRNTIISYSKVTNENKIYHLCCSISIKRTHKNLRNCCSDLPSLFIYFILHNLSYFTNRYEYLNIRFHSLNPSRTIPQFIRFNLLDLAYFTLYLIFINLSIYPVIFPGHLPQTSPVKCLTRVMTLPLFSPQLCYCRD